MDLARPKQEAQSKGTLTHRGLPTTLTYRTNQYKDGVP
jgi:hypothetical protein